MDDDNNNNQDKPLSEELWNDFLPADTSSENLENSEKQKTLESTVEQKIPETSISGEEKKPATPSHQSEVHTYYKDMQSAMERAQSGTLAGALRESRESDDEKKSKSAFSQQNLLFIGLGALLFVLGLMIFGYIFTRNQTQEVVVQRTAQVSSLVPADIAQEISTVNASRFKIFDLIEIAFRENTTSGTLQNLYFSDEVNNQRVRLDTVNFLGKVAITPPATFQRSLDDDFMFGSYRFKQETYPFLIFKVNSFDRAFDGMNEWEQNLLDDMKDVFALPTYQITSKALAEPFTDRVVQNNTTRALFVPKDRVYDENVVLSEEESYADNQDIILLYSFINEKTLVITTRPEVLLEIKQRIAEQQIFTTN